MRQSRNRFYAYLDIYLQEMANFSSNSYVRTQHSATYADVTKPDGRAVGETVLNEGDATVKPVFLKNRDVPDDKPLSHEELYMAICNNMGSAKNLKGLHRIGSLWRIYFSDRADRIALITAGLSIRNTQAPIFDTNPFLSRNESSTAMKVIIKDIPLSVSDQVIVDEIEKKKVQIMSKVQRRKLRVNGLLTECYTGDRMLFVEPPAQPLPRVMNMGSFKARVFHDGQDKGPTHCSRCLAQGHHASTCVKPIVCRKCLQPGHKSFDCDQQQAEKDDHTPDETMEHLNNKGRTNNATKCTIGGLSLS